MCSLNRDFFVKCHFLAIICILKIFIWYGNDLTLFCNTKWLENHALRLVLFAKSIKSVSVAANLQLNVSIYAALTVSFFCKVPFFCNHLYLKIFLWYGNDLTLFCNTKWLENHALRLVLFAKSIKIVSVAANSLDFPEPALLIRYF
jgi:hypothetical protein